MKRSMIALLALALAAGPALVQAQKTPCPQPRFTGQAPDAEYNRVNPLEASKDNIKAGEKLYFGKDGHPGCAMCHGDKGKGDGPLATQFDPMPRNFACAKTVDGIPDGQLAWIIHNGSPGTAMPKHDFYDDEQVWSLVLYLRTLAKHGH